MLRIKPGYGYWDTTSYPIGGCFRRAGDAGVVLLEVTREFPLFHGANRAARTVDGRLVAYRDSHAEQVADHAPAAEGGAA